MNNSEVQKIAEKSNSWPFIEARNLRDRLKQIGSKSGEENEPPVLFQTGYGPSGLPHIGTFGEVARTNIVRFAFQTLTGKNTKLICGGLPNKDEKLNLGYFTLPTIFANTSNNWRLAREEIFGPVLSIIPFETEEEAIKIVNDTEYGLGNFLQTEDKEKAKRVSRKLNAGIIYVNGIGPDSGTPFGGFKQSGNGREGGVWGLEEYLEVKTVTDW